jgi:hypothetical protein
MSRLDLNKNLLKEIEDRKSIVVEEKKKRNISIDIAKVVFVLDHSRSMSTLYTNGTVQRTLERIFPLAMQFDDNSEMEFYLFDTLFKELDTITTENIEDYTSEVIMKKRGVYGATNYAPIIEEITERYTKKEKSKTPTFVIFITDGNNADKRAAKEALVKASFFNIFWKFVGIGDEKFEFLEKLDNMAGRFIDNANFIAIKDLNLIKDKSLYSMLFEEFNEWLKLCKDNDMI